MAPGRSRRLSNRITPSSNDQSNTPQQQENSYVPPDTPITSPGMNVDAYILHNDYIFLVFL